jgi:biotin-dependent carboxylase-like uncharacterized protein
MASLRVIRPGMQTTVQDLGRWGYQSRGMPVSGAMDPRAHRTANALVSNELAAATLEVTLTGPELEFDEPRSIAVCGADFDLAVDGAPLPLGVPVPIAAGAKLAFGARRAGARAYLAVEGGIAVKPFLDSRSTHVASGIGGFAGRALVAGDRVPIGEVAEGRRKPDPAPAFAVPGVPLRSGPARVRVLAGPHRGRFADEALDTLQAAPYVVTAASNRMGFRLEGTALRYEPNGEMISDATPLGALQVPASGQPVLLMADRQTTGGYPIVAVVISADIPAVAQLAPGDSVAFAVSTPAEAFSALIAAERSLMAIEARR